MTSPGDGGFHIASAFVEITGDRSKLDREIDNLPNTTRTSTTRAGRNMGDNLVDGIGSGMRNGVQRKLSPQVERDGRGLGDKLSQGMQMSIVRNSPLIVAAVSAGLTAGAPLILAGASTLFAGIATVAAAQSIRVQEAWLGAWGQIRDGAIAAALPIQDVLVEAADAVVAGFDRMTPAIQAAFRDISPQIDGVVDSVIRMTENALPGMINAIDEGSSALQGMGEFLESVGTGVSDFFDLVGDHSLAAGSVFRGLGGTVEELLPLLGQLLGTGAEIAANTLPAMNGALALLNDTLGVVAPLLPAIAAGFLSWKVAMLAAGWVASLGTALATTAAKGGAFAGSAGAVAAGAARAGPLVGALAAVVMLVGLSMSKNSQNADRWARALMDGGTAARQAGDEMKASILGMDAAWVDSIDKWVGSIPIIGQAWDLMTTTAEENAEATEEAQRRIWASMSETERAQQNVRTAQIALNEAVDIYGPTSDQAATAAAELAAAQSHAASMAEDQEAALRGVTEAMIAMVDQSRAMVDAQFAMEDALIGVEEATTAYAEAVKEHGKGSEEAAAAQRELQRAYRDAGAAAAELAQSGLPAAVDEQTRAYFGAREELAYYQGLIEQGIDLPVWMDQHIALLERQVGGAAAAAAAQDVLRAAIEELGVAVTEVPGEKAVIITGQGTDELRQKLADLGFAIERIPGTTDYKIVADDADSEAALDNLMAELSILDMASAKPDVDIDGKATFSTDIAAMESQLLGLDTLTVTPNVETDSDVGTQTDADLNDLFGLGGTTVEPTVSTNSDVGTQTDADLNDLFGLGGTTVEPTADMQTDVPGTTAMDLGLLANLGRQRPSPVADLNDNPLISGYSYDMGLIGTLARQRPTPTAGLNDQASWGLRSILGWINSLYSRTITITTIQRTIREGQQATGRGLQPWTGGEIGRLPITAFADGGSPGGKVVGPGTGTSDDVGPFITPRALAFLSDDEWVVKARSALGYGDERMRAVNAGTATVLLPGEVEEGIRRLAHGGAVYGPMRELFDRLGSMREVATVSTRTRDVHVHVTGIFDLRDRSGMRALGVELKKVLAEIDREER